MGAAVFADLGPAPDTEGGSGGAGVYGCGAALRGAGGKELPVRDPELRHGVLDAVRALRETVPDAFVLVSFAVLPDGYTREGSTARSLCAAWRTAALWMPWA